MFRTNGLTPIVCAALATTLSLIGCGEEATQATAQTEVQTQALEVIGTWATPWGTDVITAEKWNLATIVEFDNATNTVLTQQPADDEYNPEKFSRIEWTELTDESFYYCTVAFGQDTLEAARVAEATADTSDLEGTGCGGFPWTRVMPAIEVHGTWTSEWGTENVNSHQWHTATVVSYDNTTNIAITQNPEDAEYNPGKFNKLVWTDVSAGGTFHYCTVAYGKENADTAQAVEDTSNSSDLDGAGCGGFQWTRLEQAQ